MTNEQAKGRYRGYRPGVHRVDIKDEFFKELSGYKSIFEFGCANGLNLEWIKELYPSILPYGIDVNDKEIKDGRRKGRKYISTADELHLSKMPDNSHEVVFTCSVICHIPTVKEVIENLKRIASKKVVLIETQEIHGSFYFKHDYEGFEIKRSLRSIPGNGCLYNQYEWEK